MGDPVVRCARCGDTTTTAGDQVASPLQGWEGVPGMMCCPDCTAAVDTEAEGGTL